MLFQVSRINKDNKVWVYFPQEPVLFVYSSWICQKKKNDNKAETFETAQQKHYMTDNKM